MERQVCTLEQAKTLYDLGLRAETAYYWVSFGVESGSKFALCKPCRIGNRNKSWNIIGTSVDSEIGMALLHDNLNADGAVYPAYNLYELSILATIDYYTVFPKRGRWRWIDVYSQRPSRDFLNKQSFPTEAEAKADMIINLFANDRFKDIILSNSVKLV